MEASIPGGSQALLATIERLGAARDIGRILALLRETGRLATACDGICLMLRDPHGICPAAEDAGPPAPGHELLRDTGLASLAIEQRRALLVPDVGTSELLGPGRFRASTLRSLAVLPLGAPAPFGVLIAGWSQPNAAGGARLEAIEILARGVVRSWDAVRLIEALPTLLFTSRSDGSCEPLGLQWADYPVEPDAAGTGRAWLDRRMHPDDRDMAGRRWIAALAEQRPFEIDHRFRHRDGRYRWFRTRAVPMRDAEGRVTHWAGACTEIDTLVEARLAETARREQAERRLQEATADRGSAAARRAEAERIEAVGQFTSGVAHDFNNLLTVIIGNVEFLQASVRPDRRDSARLAAMREAAERGGTLTRQLLAFARRQRLEPVSTDLNQAVAELRELLPAAIGGGLEVEAVLEPGLWPAFVDRTQIGRMMLNLAFNALDAMDAGGAVTVATRNRAVDAGEADALGLPGAGDFVEISVTDTGCGMSPQVRARAFEPFFTTKPPGKGSGLGLAQVYGFARQSGGIVTLRSAPREGTRVAILLPRASSEPDRQPPPLQPGAAGPSEVQPLPAALRPDRLVLLVDDDLAVREVTSTIVAEAGYRVIEAASGQDALDRLHDAGPVDLMVTDYAMPGMNGFELACAARQWQSDLKVLFVTGYADLTELGDVAESGILLKPFRSAKLLDKISVALQD